MRELAPFPKISDQTELSKVAPRSEPDTQVTGAIIVVFCVDIARRSSADLEGKTELKSAKQL